MCPTRETGFKIPTPTQARTALPEVQQKALHMERPQRAVSLFHLKVGDLARSTS